MLRDANDIEAGAKLDYDVCIIGGGVAGLTIAGELLGEELSVCVLESGGEQYDSQTQELYRGSAVLIDAAGRTRPFDDYLNRSRVRMLGGSANAWGAKCGVLDSADFERRSWMPHSGWPLDRNGLDPYYDRACDTLRVRPFDYDPNAGVEADRPPLGIGGAKGFETTVRHFSLVRRGGPEQALEKFRERVTSSERVETLLHANVMELECRGSRDVVSSVAVSTLAGGRFSVRARIFVLAAGGIENVRLLLLSDRRWKRGLGNDRGLVGRFFSGHYTLSLGNVACFTRLAQSLDLYTTRDPNQIWGVLSMTRELQERYSMPNFTVTLSQHDGSLEQNEAGVVASARRMDASAVGAVVQAATAEEAARPSLAGLYVMAEQQANPESRIVLATQKDALGQKRVRLEWRFTRDDFEALELGMELFARELGKASSGRLRIEPSPARLIDELGFSRHHIGATRMHRDEAEGVVDADSRVHGVDNLYISGSSVFPTCGIANPTLTIVALCHRLSDHLKVRLAA